jgi:hypothetical protein
MNLTEAEYAALESAATLADYARTCDAVKAARGGEYPDDWYTRVLASGLATRKAAQFNVSDKIEVRCV